MLSNKMYHLKHLNNQEGFSLDWNESILHSIVGKYVIGNLIKLNTTEINSQTLWITISVNAIEKSWICIKFCITQDKNK
jgi:hypothetical protein